MTDLKKTNWFAEHKVISGVLGLIVIGAIGSTILLLGNHKSNGTTATVSHVSRTQEATTQKVSKTGACNTGSVAHMGVGKYTIGTDLAYGTYQVANDGTVDKSSSPIYAYFVVYADKATYGTDGYADHQTVELDNATGNQTAKLDDGNYVEVTVGAKLTCL
jgi:hypothetical protein